MIYIQSDDDRRLPIGFDFASAMYGAIETGLDFRLTSFEEVNSGKFDSLIKRNLFVGSTEFMNSVFDRVGIEDVKLPRNSNRECRIITLKEAREIAKNGNKIFIKPLQIKLFTGLVLDQMEYSSLSKIPEETEVMCYDVFESVISSEWRVYVHRNNAIDSRNYSGDFRISPDYSYVNDIIKENSKDFPIAYTIDIGILESGENVVIEYNDMWAIGNYGLPNDLYLRLLKDRYFQIIDPTRY